MSIVSHYVSRDGAHRFTFRFKADGNTVDIFCLARPSLNGQDPHPAKTHLFDSNRICFVGGQEPRTQKRAEALAAEWAEYYLRYRRSGTVES